MKIAIVWNHPSRLVHCSFRFEQYLSGFRALGHDPMVICARDSASGFDGPLHVVASASDFESPELWRRIAADVAVIVTWHRMSAVLAAMRATDTRVIAIADTDGQLSFKVFPLAALERLMVYQGSLKDRCKCLVYWLGRVLTEGRPGSEDFESLASTRASDALIFGHEEARQHFGRFLTRYGEQALGQRLAVQPFAIGTSFLSCPVPESAARRRISAIGRWDDPQKDAELLVSALDAFLGSETSIEVVILGRGQERFAGLARRHSGVRLAGEQPQDEVARTLAGSRSIVFSSRWEGSPHAALEALALGATVIGPPIPSLTSWSDGGRFGTVSRSRRPASLAHALCREMTAWDEGERDPVAISRHWRACLAPEAVCRQMLEAIAP